MEQRAEKKIYMEKLGKRAVSAKETVAFLNVIQRQEGLILAADALVAQQAYIIEENQKDIMLARKNKMTEPLIDRLLLNENRIRKIAEEAFPVICDRLSAKGVEIRGDEAARQIDERIAWAQESDWGQEYLDAIISVKIVPAICDAVRHINKWNTGHSETIITKDYANALYFQERVDAAAVYVNASTRFTDGNEFGFGAEIGISTQKLHARGPMGHEALTTKKYVIFGNGQIRG